MPKLTSLAPLTGLPLKRLNIEACEGVNHAHPVGGWEIGEGARAWGADESPSRDARGYVR